MTTRTCKGAMVYVCRNCLPKGTQLPRQWDADGMPVQVRELPCSGKVDTQYMFHALEGGARGICVATCPRGTCSLAQGNYRATVRLDTVRRLLQEIGMEPERAVLLEISPEESPDRARQQIEAAVRGLAALSESALAAAR